MSVFAKVLNALVIALLAAFPSAGTPPVAPKSLVGDLKPAPVGADVLFIVAGDSRPTGRGAPLPRTVSAIFSEVALVRPDFVVWTGDTVYGYCDSAEELRAEHAAFIAVAQRGGVPVFNTTGNHEIHSRQTCPSQAPESLCAGDCALAQFRDVYGSAYGSFDTGAVHFILLSTDLPDHDQEIAGPQLDWLKADLESHKTARSIFVFTHIEFYSSPQIDNDQMQSHKPLKNACELHALFQRYPVKMVFSGHEHAYWHETRDGIQYFIAGGAGASLYATPDRGGFSHYIVVQVKGSELSYQLIEPGHLFTEAAKGAPGETKLWVVNANDSELPLRGIEAPLPAAADCPALTVAADPPWGATTAPKFTIAACFDRKTRLATESFAKQRSALVTVKAGSQPKPSNY